MSYQVKKIKMKDLNKECKSSWDFSFLSKSFGEWFDEIGRASCRERV